MKPILALLLVILSCGGSQSTVEVASQEDPLVGITQTSGGWWGDLSTPTSDQVWNETTGIHPGATVSGIITFTSTCHLPSPTTMKLTQMVAQVNGFNAVGFYNANIETEATKTISIDTRNFPDGWQEMRFRCIAIQTIGIEKGKITAVTNGHPLYFSNGNEVKNGSATGKNYIDSHGWYDTDVTTGAVIHYFYAQLNNVSAIIGRSLHGVVPIEGIVSNSGATTLNHWAVKVDNVIVVEFHDAAISPRRIYMLDTTKLANGTHVLAFHGHGLAASGKQLAAEVKVTINVLN